MILFHEPVEGKMYQRRNFHSKNSQKSEKISLHIIICSMKTNSKSISSGSGATACTGTSKKKWLVIPLKTSQQLCGAKKFKVKLYEELAMGTTRAVTCMKQNWVRFLRYFSPDEKEL